MGFLNILAIDERGQAVSLLNYKEFSEQEPGQNPPPKCVQTCGSVNVMSCCLS